MYKRIFGILVLAFGLFGTQCWAQVLVCGGEEQPPCSITKPFSPTNTTNTYEFFDNGRITVQFDTVLTTFDLTVTINPSIDPLDPTEFPAGTVCVPYAGNGSHCVQYDFTGTSAGPNGVPVKNTDYKGLITLTLSYVNSGDFTIHSPAFAHAPGDITTFTENILSSYSADPQFSDPTMGGKIPGLSSVGAFDEPLTDGGNDTACSLTLTPTNNASGQKAQIEVALKIVGGSNCGGTGIRDKTASLSVSMTDTSSGSVSFPALKNVEANKFHWDNKNGINEYDISLDGLADGRYTVTVFSSKVAPQSANFCLLNGSAVPCS